MLLRKETYPKQPSTNGKFLGQLQRAHEDAVARLEVRNSLGASGDDSEATGWVESDSTLADAQLTGNYTGEEGMVTKVKSYHVLKANYRRASILQFVRVYDEQKFFFGKFTFVRLSVQVNNFNLASFLC